MSSSYDRTTTLYVRGFDPKTRAKNIAYEFERFGRLVRLDIPAPKTKASQPYAFVEFENKQDAMDAFEEMQGERYKGCKLRIEWAKTNLLSDSKRPARRDRSPQRKERRRSRSPK